MGQREPPKEAINTYEQSILLPFGTTWIIYTFYLGEFGCNSMLLKMTNIIHQDADWIWSQGRYFRWHGGHHGQQLGPCYLPCAVPLP